MIVNVSGTPKTKTAEVAKDQEIETAPLKLNSIRTETDASPQVMLASRPLWFIGVLFGVPLLFLGGLFNERLRASRTATAGSRAARGAAKIAQDALERVQATGDPALGYERIHGVLMDYLTTRFEESFNGKTYAQVKTQLGALGVDAGAADMFTELLEALDYARFARSDDLKDLTRTVQSAHAAINQIEGIA